MDDPHAQGMMDVADGMGRMIGCFIFLKILFWIVVLALVFNR